jgi:WD40 repeat protein
MKKIFQILLLIGPLSIFGQKSQLMIQTGHQSMVLHSSISPDETKLFTVDYNYVGILWDLTSGKQLRTFKDLMAGDFGSDSRTILLALNNRTFQTVDLLGNVLKKSAAPPVSKLTNWDRTLYGASNMLLFHGAMIDATTGNAVKMDSKNYEGQAYASTLRQVAIGGSNRTVDVCDAQTGALLRSIPCDVGEYENASFVNFSSNAQQLMVGSRKMIHILDFATGKIKYTYKAEDDILSAILAPDGKSFLTVTASELQRINAQNGSVMWTQNSKNTTRNVIFNASGNKIVACGENIQTLDAQTGATIQRLVKHPTERLFKLFSTNDQQQLITQGAEKFMIRWNLTKGIMEKAVETEETRYGGFYEPTPDGKKVLTVKNNSNVLLETDLLGTRPPFDYPKSQDAGDIWALSISADSRYALTSSYSENKNPQPLDIFDLNTHQKVASLTSSSQTGVFGKTKNIVATQDGWDTPILDFYDVPSGKLLYQINDPTIKASATELLFSENDRYLAFKHAGGIGIVETASKKMMQLKKDGYSDGYVTTYQFSPDHRYFILGSDQGTADFYNLETQQHEPNRTIRAHLGALSGITFSKNGQFMFTAGGDNTIKVWDLATTKPTLVATLYAFAASNDWAVVTPGGHFDATPNAQKSMYYVNGTVVIPMDAMYEKFYAPRLLMRILNGEKIDPVDVNVDKLSLPPTLKILPPVENTLRNLVVEDDKPNVRRYEMSNNKITLTIAAACPSSGVSEIRLFHNGKTIGTGTRNLVVEDETTVEKEKKQSFEVQLVEGENDFRAIAFNTERTESQPDEIIVNYKTPKAQNTSNTEGGITLHLMVIGINKYKNPKYNLNYATADATSFKEAIEKGGTGIFSKTNIVFIGDDKATKEGISAELEKIKTIAKPQDVFIFYYAGHGVLNQKKEFFLVPYDVTQLYGQDEALAQKGLSANQLQQFSKDIKAQKQLFILDACQSAGALDQIVAARGAAEEKAIAQLARATGTHWLTASGSEQFASEFEQLKHGTFTYVLLEALSGKADLGGDKKITVKELDAYLQEQVPVLTEKYKGTPQYPASYGFGNDFPIGIVKN